MRMTRYRRTVPVAALAAVVLASAAPGTGLADDQVCTLIGCVSDVAVRFHRLPRAARAPGTRATLCVGDRCVATTNRSGIRLSDAALNGPGPVRVTVTLRSASGEVRWKRARVVRLTARSPNSPDCPPTCWNAVLEVDGAYLRVLPAS